LRKGSIKFERGLVWLLNWNRTEGMATVRESLLERFPHASTGNGTSPRGK
jgi:hypothetical protein